MGETLKTLSLSQEELGKVKPFISKPGKKDTGKGKIEIKNHVLIFVLDKDGQYYGYLAKKGETEFKLISKYTFTQGYVCFNGGISKADLVVKEQDLGKEIVDSIKDNLSKYNVTTQRPSQTYKLPVEEKTAQNLTERKEKEPEKQPVEKAENKEPKEKTKKEPAIKEPKPDNKVKQEEKQKIIDTPQENNKEENIKSKVKENKGGNMKTNIVYDENNKEVAQISSDKVGGFEGNIYIIDGVAIGDDGKKGKKLGKWNEETKSIEPIKKATKKSKAPAKKTPDGTHHVVTRTEDGSVKGSYVDEKHGKGGFLKDLKKEVSVYVTDHVNLTRADKNQDYTEAEEKKIQKLATFAVNKIVKDAGLTDEEIKVVDARRQELVDYAVKCVKIKYPVEKKEVVVDFDYLSKKIAERVQKGARMAFTMSDDEKADIDKILAKATPEQIRKIAYGKNIEAAKASRGLEFDKLVAKEELAKAGGAIKISGSPELQSVVRNVGIVDNEATGTAHVSLNELKNLDGVYYKLGIVPAYASALVDFVVKKHKNPQITDEEKGKLVELAHELVLNEVLTDQDVSVLVEAAALAKSFTSPIYKFKNEINGYTTGGVYHTGIIDDLVKVKSYDLRSHKAFEAAEQFVASHEDELVKQDEDREEVVGKWAEYFIKMAQTRKHLNPVVGEVAAMAELTEDQQNAIIGFVNEYKNLNDILDLTVATSSPIENKVVVEKVKHIAEKIKMQEKLDAALSSKKYTDLVDEVKGITDEAQQEAACRKGAEELVDSTVKEGELTDEEKAGLVDNVEKKIRERAGLPEKVKEEVPAPEAKPEEVAPEGNKPVEEVVPENAEETPAQEVTPEEVPEAPEEGYHGDAPVTPEEVVPEEVEKPRVVDPSEVVISEPIKINGGKRGNYQGVFVLGPHPEASNTTERGLYFVDLEKLRAAGKTLEDLQNNFNPEELFGDKDPSKRFGYAVRRVQKSKNGDYFRLDYYYNKNKNGVGTNSIGKNPRIQSYSKKDAQKAIDFLNKNEMYEKTQNKKFVKVFGIQRLAKAVVGIAVAGVALAGALGLAVADRVTGTQNTQANAAKEFGINQANAKYEQVVDGESSLLNYAGNQVFGMSKLHTILSDKPVFKPQRGFLKSGQYRDYSNYTAAGFGEVIGEQVAHELYGKEVALRNADNSIKVFYPTDPSNPEFNKREAAEEYLKGLGYTDGEVAAFLDSYEQAFDKQVNTEIANDTVVGPEEQPRPELPTEKELYEALTEVAGNAASYETVYESTDNPYLYVRKVGKDGTQLVRIKLGEGETLVDQVRNKTDVDIADEAAPIFQRIKQTKNFNKYLDIQYGEEGASSKVHAYVVVPPAVNGVYTPVIMCERYDDNNQLVSVDAWEGLDVQVKTGVPVSKEKIVEAATLAKYPQLGCYPAENYFPKQNEENEFTDAVEQVEYADETIAAKAAKKVVEKNNDGMSR